MPPFSQRYGHSTVYDAFQREQVDFALRTKLWNILKVTIWDRYDNANRRFDDTTKRIDNMTKRLWIHYFNNDLDQLPNFLGRHKAEGSYDILKRYFLECKWFQVYDLLEAIAADRSKLVSGNVRAWVNNALEEHNAAYRFVGMEIAEITDKTEIEAIEGALATADSPVRTHLEAALRMLSDKEAPDYRNSVKESISSVEAACRLITGDSSASLGDALKLVRNLHPDLAPV